MLDYPACYVPNLSIWRLCEAALLGFSENLSSIMEDGREVSERFHWASTPVCDSDDLGHSQALRLDWKLVQ